MILSYDLEKLQQEFRKSKNLKYIFFCDPIPELNGKLGPGCLSQWWNSKFVVDEIRYNSAEQFMMAEKARLFKDNETLSKILETRNPLKAKQLGRQVRNFNINIWEKESINIVFKGNLEKFNQNPDLKKYLLATGKKILAETNPQDPIWGIGISENDEHVKNPLMWKGQNLLGFVLMEVRERLKHF
jgi:ribA/ribD-fused uncharacterized protein